MPKRIDHEERKVRILKTALDVFAREGYRDTNLSLIAEHCGLSRPTLYQYFKDKDEIFYYAVKLVTGRMFQRYGTIAWDSGYGDCIQRIEYICNDIIDEAVDNEAALQSLMDVMLQSKRDHVDFSRVIVKRTIKLTICEQGLEPHLHAPGGLLLPDRLPRQLLGRGFQGLHIHIS